MKLPDNISRQTVQAIIDEWVIGERAERDREILLYLFIDGLTYEQITQTETEWNTLCRDIDICFQQERIKCADHEMLYRLIDRLHTA